MARSTRAAGGQQGAARPLLAAGAAVCALAALAGLGLLLAGGGPGAGRGAGGPGAGPESRLPEPPAGRERAGGPAAPSGGVTGPASAGAGPEGGEQIPPEVLAAIRGGPLPVPATGAAEPGDWTVRQDVDGLLALGRTGGGGGASSGAGGAGGPPDDQELRRRAEWVKRQERRNDLRVQVMRAELGVSEESAQAARRALTEFVTGKVTLYESIEGREDPRLHVGLEALRQDLAGKLKEALGPSYDAYAAMDAAGKFVLPEEKKKP